MPRAMQGPALAQLRRTLRRAAPRGYKGLDQRAVADRLPFSRSSLIDIEAGLLGIDTATSRILHEAITAGIPSSSDNGKV